MKKFMLSSVFMLCMGILLNAQNWAPIKMNEKHNFRHETSSEPNYVNTIWIDSISVLDGDTTFYLNRVAKFVNCDDWNTCTVDLQAQQFLQKTIRKEEETGIYYFEGDQNFIIHTQAQIGDTWVFDEENDLIAELFEVTQTELNGFIDSVKLISLSDGSGLILAQNFGLLSFFSYFEDDGVFNLIGLEELGYGRSIPMFYDLYDFNVGDIFQFRSTKPVNPGKPLNEVDIDKYTILSKELVEDSLIRYEVRLVSQNIYDIGIPVITQKLDTIIWEFPNAPNYAYNLYPGQYTNKSAEDLEADLDVLEEDNYCIVSCIFNFEEQKIEKYYGDPSFNQGTFTIDSGNPDSVIYNGDPLYWEKFELCLGNTELNYFGGEPTDYRVLEGYIKDGLQVGEISPDDILLPTKEILEDIAQIRLSPNPTSDFLTISGKKNTLPNLQLQIYNMHGQVVLQKQLTELAEEHSISVAHLPKGKYVVILGGYIAGRFIRQ